MSAAAPTTRLCKTRVNLSNSSGHLNGSTELCGEDKLPVGQVPARPHGDAINARPLTIHQRQIITFRAHPERIRDDVLAGPRNLCTGGNRRELVSHVVWKR